MKIGTLTLHNANNYGAVLQAYALHKYLLESGFDVEIVDYRPNVRINKVQSNFINKVMKYLFKPTDFIIRKNKWFK
jgi:hypothetical protein